MRLKIRGGKSTFTASTDEGEGVGRRGDEVESEGRGNVGTRLLSKKQRRKLM